MKKIAVLCSLYIVFLSLGAFAKTSILPATSTYCQLTLPAELNIVSQSPGLDLNAHYRILTHSLEKWMIEMDIAQDPVIGNITTPICFGFYDDAGGPNAQAYSDQALIFGVKLLNEIPNMSEATFTEATKFILAHEFAHNLQNRHRLEFNYYPLKLFSTKQKELHADCIAGYLITAHREVVFNSDSKLNTLISALGDPHAVGDHGMAKDRIQAFQNGFNAAATDIITNKRLSSITSGHIISACKRFYPTTN